MKIEIEIEFDIGDEVCVISKGDMKYEVVGPDKIACISAHFDHRRSTPNIYYYLSSCVVWGFPPDETFKTREAAEIKAEALNR